MKKIFLFLLILGALAGCKKDPPPEPDVSVEPAAQLAGTYTLSSFHFINGANEIELEKLPVVESGKTVASGTVKFAKRTGSRVTMDLSLFIEAEGTIPVVEGLEIDVRESGKNLGLYAGSDRIGDADGRFIIFNVSRKTEKGDELMLAFNAKK